MYPKDGTVLVTGATGFIGKRLVKALVEEGYNARCMVRRHDVVLPEGATAVTGDLLVPAGLDPVFRGIDTAFYLVHSMGGGRAGFERRDRQAAEYFTAAAEKAGVRRVIYLGGLGETGPNLSEHLASRLEVAQILMKGAFKTTFLRAPVIIGAGGSSYEMIRHMVERLPMMITPRWVSTRTQPIAVADVIGYLVGCLREERTAGETLDIGGPEILSYREMMERFAAIEGKSVLIIPIPFLSLKLSSYWIGLITPVKPSIAMPLIEGVRNEMVCRDQRIRELVPIKLTGFDEAIRIALGEEKDQHGK
ncbi:MAG TPA: NAD(P)H-binding protein [Geobacteraceae bacterium]|nr:NAD(P)H-binding protein [Geobacteraceae bacterium]